MASNQFRPEDPYPGFGLNCKCYSCNYCTCNEKIISSSLFLENVYDVALAVAKVMVICGIHPCKANSAKDVIVEALLNYEEVRHHVDTVPRKRVRKLDLTHDLGKKCLMTLTESQLSYAIIKRAFKAFYHGTTCNLKTITPDRKVLHNEECFWVHAAKRTAQIFASYECLFLSAKYNYECQIRRVYKELLDRLQKRTFMKRIDEPCTCPQCGKKETYKRPTPLINRSDMNVTAETKDIPITKFELCPDENLPPDDLCKIKCVADEPDEADNKSKLSDDSIKHSATNISLHLPRCYKCNCPRLMCDCEIDAETGVMTAECSQGPYVCRWVRMDDEKVEETEPCVTYLEDHVCPIDCDAESIECDECVCEDSCDCCDEEEEVEYESFKSDILSFADYEIEVEEEIETNPCWCIFKQSACN